MTQRPAAGTPETPPTVGAAAFQALAVGLADLREQIEAPEAPDAEALHRLRVALRKVRTLLAILDRAAPSPGLSRLREAAATLAEAIGRVRDWDVFVTATLAAHAPDPPTDGHAAVVATAETQRARAHADFAACRGSRNAELFLNLFAELVARRGWEEAGGTLWQAPLDALMRPALDRLQRRVLKRGRHLGRRDAEQRHKLRLAVKRLRYALDLFAPGLAEADGLAGYRRRLQALQDCLGHGNDRATARRLVDAVQAATDHADAPAALTALKRRLDDADAAAEEKLHAAWRRFRRRPPAWRDG
jgi:CHAD domain-containing protein